MQQEGDVLFQQDNAHPQWVRNIQYAPQDIQQFHLTVPLHDLSTIKNGWDNT